MTVQAEWNGFAWRVEPGCVRPITSIDGTRSVSVERNDDKEGEPATQTVALDLMTFTVNYTASLGATGRDPRDEYGEWWRNVGVYAPFYLSGRKYLGDLFLLKSAKASNQQLAADGSWLTADIELSFEEYSEEGSGLKTEKTVIGSLRPGIAEQVAPSALSVGPSDAQRAGKMPANQGM